MYKKAPLCQHESEKDYTLYSTRLEPKGPDALAVAKPKQEYGMWHAAKQEIRTFAEFIGLPGFIMKSSFNALYPDQRQGKDVYLQGSRQMDSVTRQYYERSLGAGMFVSPMTENGLVGYSEPFRRFVQHEGFAPQVNEIANDMPSWIPGDDHLIDFKKGDPYTKVDEGYARLPGGGSIYRWTRSFSPAEHKTSLARATDPTHVPPSRRHKNISRARQETQPRTLRPANIKYLPRAPAGDPRPSPSSLVPSTASQQALRSPSQRLSACFQSSCLLLATMQVMAFRKAPPDARK
jgi:hypothetical protein